MFTSTLSVSEFALLQQREAVPLAQLLGASVQQIGWQYLPTEARFAGQELLCSLDQISHAWDQARRQAFDRLAEEGRALGADAVLGVKLRRGEHDMAKRSVEFIVTGTAVRWRGSEGTAAWPALSDLSVQDYWKLESAGWEPAGLLASTAVLFVSQSFRLRWQRRRRYASNQELTEYSQAFSSARRLAVQYLRSQADAAGANGIVGVELEHSVRDGKFQVMQTPGTRSTGVSPATIAMGGDARTGGADARDGMVITIQAVGTGIRRSRVATRYPPETVVRLGAVSGAMP